MNRDQRERETLKAAFEVAHRRTAAATPPFERVAARPRATGTERPSAGRSLRWVAAAVGLLIAGVLVVAVELATRTNESDLELAATHAAVMSEWRAPLDFLLATPGREWLESTPSLGSDSSSFSGFLSRPEEAVQ